MNEEIKFIVTRELGRLAKWLRILGFDAKYSPDLLSMSHLIAETLQDNRILVTRNTHIGTRQGMRVVKIKSDFFKEQLAQIIQELDLELEGRRFFGRCILCNLALGNAVKEKIKNKVPLYVFDTQDKFLECSGCGRVYWPGTHWGNVAELLNNFV
ncbi:MAG: Mut7-C RNAse domain-containing protein [Candidatus Omnitrophica bacterium]|nr:Mut7-C RNAse domain-containing protein [Candidatus Omnitrophota bacterium]MBU1925371.1 Mut7-C RNAse domain-containing protein [Candidatus Omnitrophota bacterium]